MMFVDEVMIVTTGVLQRVAPELKETATGL